MRIFKATTAMLALLLLSACQAPINEQERLSQNGVANVTNALHQQLKALLGFAQPAQEEYLSIEQIIQEPTTSDDIQDSVQAPSIELNKNGFKLNGKYTLLRGGSLQWFKIPETEWQDRLQRFKASGFNTIDLYVAWNLHEPRPGEFDFETYNLPKFLDIAHALGLYIYLRPGPYFTNEWNGGGVPSWLIPHTTKDSLEEDGLYNLRTADPDYLAVSARYLNALNQVVSPYFIENGGPIILYSVENEYDWFETIFEGEKAFTLDGKPERPSEQALNTGEYLGELRDIVRQSTETLPITTCPGKPEVSGMGDVEGVVPMPNIYCSDYLEKRAMDIVTSMHDPEQFGGAYVDYPSATTETNRQPAMMKRLVMGGLDGYFGFNIFGSHQEGRNNSVVAQVNGPDTRCYGNSPAALGAFQPETIFDFTIDNLLAGFVSPVVGYFHNVIDYGGIVSPSGVMRPQFYQFRRANLFFDDFQETIGGQEYPNRSGGWWWSYEDDRVTIDHGHIGAAEGWSRYHYWYEGTRGEKILSVLNESHVDQVLSPESIYFDGETLPLYTELTVPAEQFPQGELGDLETDYAMLLVANLELNSSLNMAYSTSEVLMHRSLDDEKLLILYGKENTQGELVLEKLAGDVNFTLPEGVELVDSNDNRYAFVYEHSGLKSMLVETTGEQDLRIVILTTDLAGRTWHHQDSNGAGLTIGLDYVVYQRGDDGALALEYEQEQIFAEYYIWIQDDSTDGFQRFTISRDIQFASLPDISAGTISAINALEQGLVNSATRSIGDSPQPLEELDFFKGHYLYEADVYLDHVPFFFWDERSFYVQHASDIVGIYVNGHYITTVVPMGTEIHNDSWVANYVFEDVVPYLHEGLNQIAFKVEIWGHGSFMWARGKLSNTHLAAPALGYDGFKGLYGEATLAGAPLENWRVTPLWTDDYILGAELEEVQTEFPYTFGSGESARYTTHFATEEIPNRADFHAPMVIEIKGKSSKGTIFLNGRLIGRWLSDNDWLAQGSWVRGRRDMWMTISPDHFPIAPGTLYDDGRANQLVVLFEDVSDADSNRPGYIDSVRLTYSEEDFINVDGTTEPLVHTWEKGSILINP
ncbi:MAG: hypothetical protein HOK28_12280 [Deltaproteobacteria bacterium]|nr:hypothetical protein [Deltaproteobacteria bacterium]